MDVQNQRKNHSSSGQDVHLCPKCGWPYPNPHPSAKHRRAHHRVCGSIEGYKSGLVSDSHSNVPDHDHSDEEQHPIPIPIPIPIPYTGSNVLERNLDPSEKPDGSKEEAFLDAVTHFPEASPTPLVDESSSTVGEMVDALDKNPAIDLNGLDTRTISDEIGQKTLDSSYTSMQNLLEPKNASQELSDTKIKEPSTCSPEQEEAKFLEAPNDFLDQSNGVAAPSSLDVGSEPTMDSSTEVGISTDSKIVNKQLADDSVKEYDIITNEQTRPVPSLLTKDADVIFATVPSEEFASIEVGQIDTVSTVHQSETPDSVSSGNLPVENLKEDKNFQTYVIPKDIPVIEQPETLIKGYKDYPEPKLHLAEDLASPDTILQKQDSFVFVSGDSSMTEIKVQKELSDVPSSDRILPQDKSEPDGDLEELKEDVPIIPEGGDNACKSEKLETETIDQDLSLQDLSMESSISVSHEIKATQIPHDTGENNLSESHVKYGTISPEIPVQQNEVQEKSVTNIIEVEKASDTEKPKTEQAVVPEVETREGYFKGKGNLKATTAEYAVEPAQLDGVSAHEAANVRKDVECSEEKGELYVVDAETIPESTIKYQVDKEAVLVQSSDTVSPSHGSVTVKTNQSRDPSLKTPKIPIEDEYVENFFKTEPVVSAPERSVDLNSRTDSLEANWGSISVLSTQSDPSITTESELLAHSRDVTPIEAAEPVTEAEGKGSEKTDAFEAPSFLTLVEPGVGMNQTDGALAQQEDKKEGIIPNQGAGNRKHHSALKNLLVEATQESKLKSSSQKDSLASVQNDETAVTTVGKILAVDDRKSGGSVKEWDSPARYPADIKREKRKVKGHWMPFICCSSVN